MFKLGLEKAEELGIKLPTSAGSKRKRENSRKRFTSASLTMLKLLTVWITTSCTKFLEVGVPGHLTCLLRNLYAGQEATVRTDMEQQTGSKLGKKYVKPVYCHPACFTYMQGASHGMPGWMECQAGWSASGNQDCQEKYQWPQIGKWHHLYGRKWRGTKELLNEDKRAEFKSWLIIQLSKN